jgi:hypothetical protein
MNTSKVFLTGALGLVAALIAGCASMQTSTMTLDPVGPPPTRTPMSGGQGALVVYSAFETHANFYSTSPYRRIYTDYKVLYPNGELVQIVHNDPGGIADAPVAVTLPSGNYRVMAQANKYGMVTVPIVIAAGEITAVHLEGGANSWPDRPALEASNPVRLPDGRIVGWRAPAAAAQP